jgi:hypothetical protein
MIEEDNRTGKSNRAAKESWTSVEELGGVVSMISTRVDGVRVDATQLNNIESLT